MTLKRDFHLQIFSMLLILSSVASLPPAPSRPLPTDYGGNYFSCTRDADCANPIMYCNRNNPNQPPYCDCGIFHTWSLELNSCVGLVNTSCALGRHCASNSFCNHDEWCECDKTHSANKDRKCQLAYGSPCDPSLNSLDICNTDQLLSCNYMTKVCNCTYSEQMKYDEILGQCRMLVGEPCDPMESSYYRQLGQPQRNCVQRAICRRGNINDTIGKCDYESGRKVNIPTRTSPTSLSTPILQSSQPLNRAASFSPELSTSSAPCINSRTRERTAASSATVTACSHFRFLYIINFLAVVFFTLNLEILFDFFV